MESDPTRCTKRDFWDCHPKSRDGKIGNAGNAEASSPEKELKGRRKASNLQETECNLSQKGWPDEKLPPISIRSEGASTVEGLSKSAAASRQPPPPPPPRKMFVDNSRKAGAKPPPPPPPFCQCAGILTGQRPQENHPLCVKTVVATKPQPKMRQPAVRKEMEPTGWCQGHQQQVSHEEIPLRKS